MVYFSKYGYQSEIERWGKQMSEENVSQTHREDEIGMEDLS